MFASVLYPDEAAAPLAEKEPDYFTDLNLDQMVAQIVRGRERYHLEPHFYTALRDPKAIAYRQDVLRDLGDETLLQAVRAFSEQMAGITDSLKGIAKALSSSDSYENNLLTRGKHLNLVRRYLHSVGDLRSMLRDRSVRSGGLLALLRYLDTLSEREDSRRMADRVDRLYRNLETVDYCMLIKEGTIRVRNTTGSRTRASGCWPCSPSSSRRIRSITGRSCPKLPGGACGGGRPQYAGQMVPGDFCGPRGLQRALSEVHRSERGALRERSPILYRIPGLLLRAFERPAFLLPRAHAGPGTGVRDGHVRPGAGAESGRYGRSGRQ